jgi:hypothetical protein
VHHESCDVSDNFCQHSDCSSGLSNGSRSGDTACVKISVIQKSDQVYPPGRDH